MSAVQLYRPPAWHRASSQQAGRSTLGWNEAPTAAAAAVTPLTPSLRRTTRKKRSTSQGRRATPFLFSYATDGSEEGHGKPGLQGDAGCDIARGAREGTCKWATLVQVYLCSRTHSQLSQFVGELKRTRYRDSMSLAAMASRQASLLPPHPPCLSLQNLQCALRAGWKSPRRSATRLWMTSSLSCKTPTTYLASVQP